MVRPGPTFCDARVLLSATPFERQILLADICFVCGIHLRINLRGLSYFFARACFTAVEVQNLGSFRSSVTNRRLGPVIDCGTVGL